eukprot:7864516-Prorocentrum_lima.AAC.1
MPANAVASNLAAALDLLLDPITGSPARGKKVEGIVILYVDDCVFTGTHNFHKKVVLAEGLCGWLRGR